MISSTTVRKAQTTWQRAMSQARKLEPATVQQGQSLFFDVASVSIADAYHHVTLGPNKANVLLDSKCDCSSSSKWGCLHKVAALLQLTANLEERLWKGCDLIVQAEDMGTETAEGLEAMYALFQDLLVRYERGVDLIRAIEQGQDINNFTGRVGRTSPDNDDKQLLTA